MTHCVANTITRNERSIARRGGTRRRSFTLIELLITIMIIAMLAAMVLFALFRAQEEAKRRKTSALISRLDAIIKGKYESYKTRRVPVRIPPGTDPNIAAKMRLDALRDLMRLELPDRWSDVVDMPTLFTYPAPVGNSRIVRPSRSQAYLRKYNAIVTGAPSVAVGLNAGAECLYMIVNAAMSDESDARGVFKADNIGDTDNDGFPEFLDGWRMPIKFLRWAPGFQYSELQIRVQAQAGGGAPNLTLTGQGLSSASGSYVGGAIVEFVTPPSANPSQPAMFDTLGTSPDMAPRTTRIIGYQSAGGVTATITMPAAATSITVPVAIMAPDPFDPLGAHASTAPTPPTVSFALYPLVYSAGPDKCFAIVADFDGTGGGVLQYSTRGVNPFIASTDNPTSLELLIGTARNNPAEANYNVNGWLDNIHNHTMGVR